MLQVMTASVLRNLAGHSLGQPLVLGETLIPGSKLRMACPATGPSANRKSRYPSAQATVIDPISTCLCGGSASSTSTVRLIAALNRAICASRAASCGLPCSPRHGTAASRMPSPIDWNFSARQRGAPCGGKQRQFFAQAVEILADQLAAEQRQPVVGHQARHFRQRIVRQKIARRDACGLVGCFSIRPSRPRMIAQAMTLRT